MTLSRRVIRGALALLCALCIAVPPPEAAAATVLTEGHADIYLAYEGGRWAPSVKTDSGSFPAEDTVLQVPLAARRPAPDNPAFATCLGVAGTPVWLLPQVATSGLLFLGYTTNVPPGTFTDNRVNLTLRSNEGTGQVCVYTTNAFGAPSVIFNTRDGIAAADTVALDGQSHGHWNWSFSMPGTYRLGLEVSGATATGPSSATMVYTFEVVGDSTAATATPAAPTASPVAATSTPAPSATAAVASATATPPTTDPTPQPTVAQGASPTPPAAAPTIRPTTPVQPPAASPSLPPGITIPVIPTLGAVVTSPTSAPVGATPRGAGTGASPNPSVVSTARTATIAPTPAATPVPAPSEQEDPARAVLLALGITLVVALGSGAYLRLKGM